MSDPLNETTSSTSSVPTETKTTTATPRVESGKSESVNLTQEILAGLSKQLGEKPLEDVASEGLTQDAVTALEEGLPEAPKPEPEEPVEPDVETLTEEDEVGEYDPEALFTESRKKINEVEQLRSRVSELQNQIQQMQQAPGAQEPKGAGERPLQMLEFLNDDDYEEVMSSPEAMNRFANKIFYTSMHQGQIMSQNTAAKVVLDILQVHRVIDNYLNSQPVLRNHERLMSLVMKDVQGRKPNLKLDELLTEAGAETLRLVKAKAVKHGKLVEQPVQQKSRPAFARPTGGGRRGVGGDSLTEAQKMWADF